jgi:hypothetical protein
LADDEGKVVQLGAKPKLSCMVCDAELEMREEGLPAAATFYRGFEIGVLAAMPEARARILRDHLCLRHCHELQMHEAWSDREDASAEPEPGT